MDDESQRILLQELPDGVPTVIPKKLRRRRHVDAYSFLYIGMFLRFWLKELKKNSNYLIF